MQREVTRSWALFLGIGTIMMLWVDVEQGIEDAKLEDEKNRAKVNEWYLSNYSVK